MIKRILFREESHVVSAAMVVAFFGLVSRVLGLLRDRFLASQFGASDELDIYFAAFKIPDFIYTVLILGAISAVLIPIFLETLEKDKEGAFRFLNVVLNDFIIVASACALFAIVFTPWLLKIITPGFDGEKLTATIHLTRIMLLSPLLLGISNIISGVLQAFRRFLIFSLSPVFYNLGIIIGIFFFAPRWGITGVAGGVVLGALLHLLIQVPALRHLGFSYRPEISFHDERLRKAVFLMIPRSLAIVSSQLNSIIIISIASLLQAGSISVMNFSNNLQSVALGLLGIPFAIAAFPALSSLFVAKKREEFSAYFTNVSRKIIYLAAPVAFMFLLLRAQIVRLVLGSGKFSWEDTQLTAAALGLFSVSIIFQSLSPLFLRGFYAVQNTKTPFIISIIADCVSIVIAFSCISLFRMEWFAGLWRSIMKLEGIPDISVLALPIAFSLASVLQVVLLLKYFRTMVSKKERTETYLYLYKILFISVVAYFCAFWALRIPVVFLELTTFFAVALQAAFACVVGGGIYFMLSFTLGVPEAQEMIAAFGRLNKKLFKRFRVTEPIPREEQQ
jgi:putative peptidoglycan lipid II flippase